MMARRGSPPALAIVFSSASPSGLLTVNVSLPQIAAKRSATPSAVSSSTDGYSILLVQTAKLQPAVSKRSSAAVTPESKARIIGDMGLVMLEEIVEQLVEPRFARIDAIGLEAALHQRLAAARRHHRARVLEGNRGEPFADQQRVVSVETRSTAVSASRAVEVENTSNGRGEEDVVKCGPAPAEKRRNLRGRGRRRQAAVLGDPARRGWGSRRRRGCSSSRGGFGVKWRAAGKSKREVGNMGGLCRRRLEPEDCHFAVPPRALSATACLGPSQSGCSR